MAMRVSAAAEKLLMMEDEMEVVKLSFIFLKTWAEPGNTVIQASII